MSFTEQAHGLTTAPRIATCWLPGGAVSHGPAVQWWSAVDGSGLRGYGPASVTGALWEAMTLLGVLDGASAGHDFAYHYVVETDIPAHAEADFNAWYDTEHLPGLANVAGTVRARRYRREGHHAPRYLACYDLVSPEVMQSAAWLAVRHTAWSARVRPLFFNTRRTLHVRLRHDDKR